MCRKKKTRNYGKIIIAAVVSLDIGVMDHFSGGHCSLTSL